MKINVAKDFSETPGGRYRSEGNYSAEEFLDAVLAPAYEKVLKNNEKLVVDFDGCYGVPVCFLAEAFSGLVEMRKEKGVSDHISVSPEDATLDGIVRFCILNAEANL